MASEQRTMGGARPGAGRPPNPDALVVRAFTITKDQARMIEAHARKSGLSRSEWVRRVLEAYAAGR